MPHKKSEEMKEIFFDFVFSYIADVRCIEDILLLEYILLFKIYYCLEIYIILL